MAEEESRGRGAGGERGEAGKVFPASRAVPSLWRHVWYAQGNGLPFLITVWSGMLIPGSSTCCNKRNRQGCQCTTATKGREGRGGMGCRRSFVSPPIAGHGMGRETTDPAWKGRSGRGRRGISFIERNPASLPALPPHPKEKKYNKSLTAPGAGVALRFWGLPPPVLSFPSSRGSSPGPTQPSPSRPPLPLPRRDSTKERGGPAPRHPRAPHYCPRAGPRARLQLGFARRSHDVIRKSNEIMFSNSKNWQAI